MYAIQLFHCIDFVPLFIYLQGAQKLNVSEEVE